MNRAVLTIVDGFLSPAECHEILTTIGAYRDSHEAPLIDRRERGRSLRYRVIDGNAIAGGLPGLESLYRRTGRRVEAWCGRTLTPIANRVAGINVNITPPGGEYRWHYDRNEITAIVYLNDVEGGATEVYANHRILLPRRLHALQPRLDAFVRAPVVLAAFGRKSVIRPRAGRLVVMRGDRCLHSVCPVEGTVERINLCMAYEPQGSCGAAHHALDTYLYTDQAVGGPDPNYLG